MIKTGVHNKMSKYETPGRSKYATELRKASETILNPFHHQKAFLYRTGFGQKTALNTCYIHITLYFKMP